MKRISTIIMALVMVMTMAQCKKDSPTTPDNQNNVVTITLDVKNNNGSRVDVNTTTGTVDFETGDKVYVGSGGKYVGFLTHNGTNFVGNITNPTENQPLQFYFLGNVTPQETLSVGTTEECSVIISDQTEHLPVISCAASYENYVSGVTAYSAHLLNKCALVKFNVTTPSNSPICVTGMKNKVTVDFTQNTMTPSMDGEGMITLPAGSGENVEKWAILLPQEALEEGEEGSAYSEDGNYSGIRPEIPMITENGYFAEGIGIVVNNNMSPVGAINGLFSVSPSQKVYFSQGNLQYQASTNTWRLADSQWDYIGGYGGGDGFSGNTGLGSNSLISSAYDGWIDLFGWGTSGYDHGAVCYQPWSISTTISDYYAYGSYLYNLFDQSGKADWGYNEVNNGGNNENIWRTLSFEEWSYILYSRNVPSGIRFAKAIVNETNGIILLPDTWNPYDYPLGNGNNNDAPYSSNIISEAIWMNSLQSNGAVFLPAGGYRHTVSTTSNTYNYVYQGGNVGCYWSASCSEQFIDNCYAVGFSGEGINVNSLTYRYTGYAVRLVQDY